MRKSALRRYVVLPAVGAWFAVASVAVQAAGNDDPATPDGDNKTPKDPWWWAAAGELPDSSGDSPVDFEVRQEEAPPDEKKKRGEIVVAPIPLANPTFGAGLGAIAAYVFPLNPKDTESPPSYAGIGGFYTDNGTWAFGFAHKGYVKQDRYRYTVAAGAMDLRYDFYGVGNSAGQEGFSVPLEQDGWAGAAELQRRFGKDFYAGLRYKYFDSTTEIGDDFEGTPPDGTPDGLELATAAIGLHLEVDRRDNVFNPTTGPQIDLRADFYDDAWGSQADYQKYKFSFNSYRTVKTESQVVAWRAFACAVRGDVPFYDLCLFGSGSDLRGYAIGRFRDRTQLAFQAEYRWLFWKSLGMVAFGGVGQVAESFGDYSTDDLLPSIGTGLRILVAKQSRINVRIDYAYGEEGSTVYISVGEAF